MTFQIGDKVRSIFNSVYDGSDESASFYAATDGMIGIVTGISGGNMYRVIFPDFDGVDDGNVAWFMPSEIVLVENTELWDILPSHVL